MKNCTQIILIGHTKKRLIEGIKQFPTDKLILILGANPKLEGEAKVIETATALETIFNELMETERIYVDKEDIFSASQKILTIIVDEITKGNNVRINISGSLRQMAIACYIAALVSRTPVYSVIPEYDQNYNEIGVKKVYSVPFFPIKEISKEKIETLKILKEKEFIESIDQLITILYPEFSEEDYNRLRAKVSYYLKDLEDEGFIQKMRIGKKAKIELTPVGKIYVLGQRAIELKNN